jgi:hypothetical protein
MVRRRSTVRARRRGSPGRPLSSTPSPQPAGRQLLPDHVTRSWRSDPHRSCEAPAFTSAPQTGRLRTRTRTSSTHEPLCARHGPKRAERDGRLRRCLYVAGVRPTGRRIQTAAHRCQTPGTPVNSGSPRSSKSSPDPATRSLTVPRPQGRDQRCRADRACRCTGVDGSAVGSPVSRSDRHGAARLVSASSLPVAVQPQVAPACSCDRDNAAADRRADRDTRTGDRRWHLGRRRQLRRLRVARRVRRHRGLRLPRGQESVRVGSAPPPHHRPLGRPGRLHARRRPQSS